MLKEWLKKKFKWDERVASRQGIAKRFNAHAKRPEHLENLLARLETMDTDDLPFSEKSKVVQHLSNQVVNLANENGFVTHYDNGVCVDERKFKREITQIHNMLGSMEMSQFMRDWTLSGAVTLAVRLEQVYPYKETAAKWPKLGIEEKVSILEDITKLQTEVFKDGAIDLLPSPVKLQTDVPALGYILTKPIDLNTLKIPELNINKGAVLSEQFNVAALTTVHEQFHSYVTQLAIAEHNGWMPENHPMAKDAEISQARREFMGTAMASIRSVYEADPEEKLAFLCHRTFNAEYAGPTARQI